MLFGQAFLHSSMEAPDIAVRTFYSTIDIFKSLEVSAISTFSTENVRFLNVEQRKCRFPTESTLVTSPVYSYRLCRNECRMKLARKLCGCVPYFYRASGR